jgi:NADH dehydrogenase
MTAQPPEPEIETLPEPANGRPRIVIVGGGAGGVELAARLGDSLGRRREAEIVLVDKAPAHLWKPLLHEVAAGTIDVNANEIAYLALARWHCFMFQQGALESLDRARKEVIVGEIRMPEGDLMFPPRRIAYTFLVLAVGSVANDFGVKGVEQNALMLDTVEEAERINRRIISMVARANATGGAEPPTIHVVIIGGGATGVELAAQMRTTGRVLAAYGLDRYPPEKLLHITLLEAGTRILPHMPERIADGVHAALKDLDVEVMTGVPVTSVEQNQVVTKQGRVFPAQICVWAAGVKAPSWLASLDGLETSRLNQLVVTATLQTTRDPRIFALGDCAQNRLGPGEKDGFVAPLAQAAHQQAAYLARALPRILQGKPVKPFRYRHFGSLIALGQHSTSGTLMGFITGHNFRVQGWIARLMYLFLYRQHLAVLYGWWHTALDSVARWIGASTRPKIKLH